LFEDILVDSPATKTNLKQVQRAANRIRKHLLSALENETVGDLRSYLESRELKADSNDHDVGILKGWVASCEDHSQEEPSDILFAITTKRLLYQLVEQSQGQLCSFIEADATYNLTQNGYPCLVIGMVDANHSFRTAAALLISRREDNTAFSNALNCTISKITTGIYISPAVAPNTRNMPSASTALAAAFILAKTKSQKNGLPLDLQTLARLEGQRTLGIALRSQSKMKTIFFCDGRKHGSS
jgi:hypothetical protein